MTDIQIGDVVLAHWSVNYRIHGADLFYPRLRTSVGRVRNICDHYEKRMGVERHTGTSVLLDTEDQVPIQECRVLFRPFKGEAQQ